MKAEYVNPILEAFYSLLQNFAGTRGQREKLVKLTGDAPGGDMTILLPLAGECSGRILIIMDRKSALTLGRNMLLGFPVKDMDGLTRDAIQELSLRIAAKASELLAKRGLRVNLLHPRLVEGRETRVAIQAPTALGMSVNTDAGLILLVVDIP